MDLKKIDLILVVQNWIYWEVALEHVYDCRVIQMAQDVILNYFTRNYSLLRVLNGKSL